MLIKLMYFENRQRRFDKNWAQLYVKSKKMTRFPVFGHYFPVLEHSFTILEQSFLFQNWYFVTIIVLTYCEKKLF